MTNYPNPVLQKTNQMINSLSELLEESDALVGKEELEESFSKRLLKRFLTGTDLELSDAEIEESVEEASMTTAYNGLVRKGMMDCIEDENGEAVYFLTDKGKKLGEFLTTQK